MAPYETPAWFLTGDVDEPTRLRRYFDGMEEVDPINGYGERNINWFEREILPDFLNAKARLSLGPTLLDVGCAYGYFTRRFADHFSYVLGVDFAAARIAGAKERNAANNVEYVEADLVTGSLVRANDRERTGRPDLRARQLNSAVSSAVLQHIAPSNRARAFMTIHEALAPRAHFILYDESFEDRPEQWDGFYEALSPHWISDTLINSWSLKACDFVALGLNGERIYRYELSRL